jgi:two-component system, chemotaxis family, protein-glutamate methylesterase/glutaminase
MEGRKVIEATCPDCRGPLTEVNNGDFRQYRCLVGHRYAARSLLEAHSETQENALWSAVAALESANLVRAVALDLPPELAERLQRQAEKKKEQAEQLRRILEQLEPFQLD